jgi:hypothetical protein
MDSVNLGRLRQEGRLLYTREVAAVLHAVCERLLETQAAGQAPVVPSPDEVWVTPEGAVQFEAGGNDAAVSAVMPALGALIEALLPPYSPQPDYAVPMSFRLLAPRGRGKPGLPPLTSVAAMLASVRRFEAGPPEDILRGFARRISAVESPPLDRRTTRRVPPPNGREPVRITLAEPDHSAAEPASTPPAVTDAGPPVSGDASNRTIVAVLFALAAGILLGALGTAAYMRDGAPLARSEPVPPDGLPVALVGVVLEETAWLPGAATPKGTAGTLVPEAPKSARALSLPGVSGPVFSPAFDAGGGSLLFHAGRDEARLMRARLSGTGAPVEVTSLLDGGTRDYHARPSPDGAMMAFDSDRDGERGVYLARRDGSSPRRISGEGFAAVPSWSPDMTRLTFVRADGARKSVWSLWIYTLATQELTRLTSYPVGQVWGASWFPDGERICYSHEDRLVVRDLATGTEQTFPSPRRRRLVRTPAVSPDGTRVVFQLRGDGVWLLDLRNERMRRLLADPTAEEFAWHPAGDRIAYHSRKDGEWRIWVAPAPRS